MRFDFGKNWTSFSQTALNEEKIAQAREDFRLLLAQVPLKQKSFLDIGFGQGLALCFASEMGAIAQGLDVDPNNLKAFDSTIRFFDLDSRPQTEIASILDPPTLQKYLDKGGFDVVHSWGVLHHTGQMHQAIENAARLVKPGGFFVLAIYRRHWSSILWRMIKWLYNVVPPFAKKFMVFVLYYVIFLAKFLVTGKNPKEKQRGMSFFHDVVDWVGGYRYEYAASNEIISFVENLGYEELKVFPAKVPTGCNEYIFRRK